MGLCVCACACAVYVRGGQDGGRRSTTGGVSAGHPSALLGGLEAGLHHLGPAFAHLPVAAHKAVTDP